jgi:hypothetical protein
VSTTFLGEPQIKSVQDTDREKDRPGYQEAPCRGQKARKYVRQPSRYAAYDYNHCKHATVVHYSPPHDFPQIVDRLFRRRPVTNIIFYAPALGYRNEAVLGQAQRVVTLPDFVLTPHA